MPGSHNASTKPSNAQFQRWSTWTETILMDPKIARGTFFQGYASPCNDGAVESDKRIEDVNMVLEIALKRFDPLSNWSWCEVALCSSLEQRRWRIEKRAIGINFNSSCQEEHHRCFQTGGCSRLQRTNEAWHENEPRLAVPSCHVGEQPHNT